MLTDEQKEKYVTDGGVRCPYCDSGDIEGGYIETDMGVAEQKIWCNQCGKRWWDYYNLSSIEEEEERERV
jgi:hypothetical protein